MSAHYDRIAGLYVKTHPQPIRAYVEEYSFWQIIGDVSGQSVLDLACGDGLYTRQCQERGASRVVGVDVSAQMIALAKKQEKERPLGIEYRVKDAIALGKIGEFDCAISSYLLAYAQTRSQLWQMCQTIFINLKPGGRFVTITTDYQYFQGQRSHLEKYDIFWQCPAVLQAGDVISFTLKTIDDRDVSFDNYYFSRKTYEEVLRDVGFSEIRWHSLQVSPEGIAAKGKEYWQDFLDRPLVIGIECWKPKEEK
jgi:ubiquinone/menaquinone biosynthesis C-methylase UbiE